MANRVYVTLIRDFSIALNQPDVMPDALWLLQVLDTIKLETESAIRDVWVQQANIEKQQASEKIKSQIQTKQTESDLLVGQIAEYEQALVPLVAELGAIITKRKAELAELEELSA
jgi:hypothetical protein